MVWSSLAGTAAWHGGKDWEDLQIFQASLFEGSWTPHPPNPVIADVRYAGAAGRIFVTDSALIQAAIRRSMRYWYAITPNRTDLPLGPHSLEPVAPPTPDGIHVTELHARSIAPGIWS